MFGMIKKEREMFEFVQTEVKKGSLFPWPTIFSSIYSPPKLIELKIIKETRYIHNYINAQVAWVRVDTQTILTIDDMVITRSQRISVRHMTDASVDYPYYLHHPHQQHPQHAGHHKNNNKSLTVSGAEGSPQDHPRRASGGGGSIHKTWQLIIREVQSSDAGLYVS